MHQLSHFTILTFILNVFFSFTLATQCNSGGPICTFVGLTLTKLKPCFNPSVANNSDIGEIETVNFENSLMHSFTDEICKAFPHINRLEAEKLVLKNIVPNALHQCHNLTAISFYRNELKTFDINIFQGNPKVTYISLQNNAIEAIDGRMFIPVTDLQMLALGNNFLTEFPVHQFPKLKIFQFLSIFGNDLVDLDVEEMFRKFPSFSRINMHNNVFDCGRLEIILKELRNNQVSIIEFEKHLVDRNKHLPKIDNVECDPAKLAEANEDTPDISYDDDFFIINNVVLLIFDICLLVYFWVVCRNTWFEKISVDKVKADYYEYYEFVGF